MMKKGICYFILISFVLFLSCNSAIFAEGHSAYEMTENFSGYNAENSSYGESNARNSISGTAQTVAQSDKGQWQLSGVWIGAAASDKPGSSYIGTSGKLIVKDQWVRGTSVNFVPNDSASGKSQYFKFVSKRLSDVRACARLMISNDEKTAFEFGFGRSGDSPDTSATNVVKQRTPYFLKRENGTPAKTTSPEGSLWAINTTDNVTWEIWTDEVSISWTVTYRDIIWSGYYKGDDVAQLDDDKKYPFALVTYGDGSNEFDDIVYKCGDAYLSMGEPRNVLYRNVTDIDKPNDNNVVTSVSSYVTRKIICADLKNITANIGLSDDGQTFDNITAQFDENGEWLNTMTERGYRYIKMPDGYNYDSLIILTDVGEDTSFDLPEGKTTQLYAVAHGQVNPEGIKWSSDNLSSITVDDGLISGIRDGSALVTAKLDSVEFKINVRYVGELTYAIENGLVVEYLNSKRPIFSRINNAVSQKNRLELTNALVGDDELSISKIYAIDASGIATLFQESETGFDDFLDRIMTYPAFACENVEDIFYLEAVLNEELVVGRLNNLKDTSLIETVINEYNDIFQLPLTNKYYLAQKNNVLADMSERTFQNMNNLRDIFRQSYVMKNYQNSDSYAYIGQLIEDCSAEIGYDNSKFKNRTSNEKQQMNIYLLKNKNSIVSTEILKASIDSFEPEAEQVKEPSQKSSGSGNYVTLPKVEPITTSSEDQPSVIVEKTELYPDVPIDFWAYEPIRFLTAIKALSGYEDGNFQPDGMVTRAEFIKIMLTSLKIPLEEASAEQEDGEKPFADIIQEDWFYPYMVSAHKNGILMGDLDGRCFPERRITRQEMAVIIYRSVVNQNKTFDKSNDIKEFTDSSLIDEWAFPSVIKLQLAGILSGAENGRFNPTDNATRAEAAKAVYETSLRLR